MFTSTIEYYYDIKAKDKFERLFGETYIRKNPTPLKNSYHILRFNFSGIDTSSVEATINGFKVEVISSIKKFVEKYSLNYNINKEDESEMILDRLFMEFKFNKPDEKIYVIIDEYDYFANKLLELKVENITLVIKKIRKWYEILKKGTETVVSRIFPKI